MKLRLGAVGIVAMATVAMSPAGSLSAVELTKHTFGNLKARAIGPAVMSGRIAALDAVADRPLTIYVGAASGGVWKSTDAGTTFEPVFDEHIQSIGAIAIDPADPDTVWVGTGESWVRNSVSVGDGVYRTTDGGESWTNVGLPDSERIARIRVHPEESDTVWVCATGPLWSPGGERGVYRTTNGGTTWERVLQVDESTGCSDLAIDPQEPDILYAGMWQFRREPDYFTSGGPGSGLYRTTDGGDTWEELSEGLPEGDKGRIAVAMAPSRPSRVYAVVEADDTALYRSDDLGGSWTEVNSSFNVTTRPFYFALLEVDSEDHDTVYKPGLTLTVSIDGGDSFTSAFLGGGGSVHSDHHALWINPENRNELILGTDGGVYISRDRGHHFSMVRSLPVSQFYHVSADMDHPYNVFGGLQDNGTWMGPSRSPGGIQNRDWRNIGYGDGFWAFSDPTEPDIMYVEYQGGELLRVRESLSEIKSIKPYAGDDDDELRFNWNAPIHLSPNESGTLYVGAQYLLRSRDRGESWERVSPDLTTDDPERQRQATSGGLTIDNTTAENNATIYAISESPADADVIWVGTDDGNLQLTRDGGATWTNVVGTVPDVPDGTWVSSVYASPHDAGTAYVAFDGHRSGDMRTYVFRTRDFGAAWERLGEDEIEGYARVVKDDPENPNLLFAGTEAGLFLSLDGGDDWARFEGNVPPVPVHDLMVHPREGDLIVGTHGRGVYILDDLTPLRQLTGETLKAKAALLPSRPAQMRIAASLQEFSGDDELVGPNPPEAAVITYWIKRRHLFGDLKVEIYDADGELLKTVPGTKHAGINRVIWPMRLEPPKVPPASSLAPGWIGPRVPEGRYTVKLIKGDDTYEGEIEIVADPRSPHGPEDRALQQKTSLELYDDLEQLAYVVESVEAVRDAARERSEALDGRGRLARRLTEYADGLEAFRAELVSTSEAGWLSGEEKLRERLAGLYGTVTGYDGRPTNSQLGQQEVLERQLSESVQRFERLTGERLDRLNRKLERKDLEPIAVATRAEWEADKERGGAGVVLTHDLGSAIINAPTVIAAAL